MKKICSILSIIGVSIFFAAILVVLSWGLCITFYRSYALIVFWIMMVLALVAFEGWQLSKLIRAVCALLSDKKQNDAEEDDEQEKAEILKEEAYLATWFICLFVFFGLIYASLIHLISFAVLLMLALLFSACMCCLGKLVA
jgi:hypothetical protein